MGSSVQLLDFLHRLPPPDCPVLGLHQMDGALLRDLGNLRLDDLLEFLDKTTQPQKTQTRSGSGGDLTALRASLSVSCLGTCRAISECKPNLELGQ